MANPESAVPSYMEIKRRRGRIDPIVQSALKTFVEELEAEKPTDEILEKKLRSHASAIRQVTQRLDREHQSELDRILLSNGVVYSRALEEAVDKWAAAQGKDDEERLQVILERVSEDNTKNIGDVLERLPDLIRMAVTQAVAEATDASKKKADEKKADEKKADKKKADEKKADEKKADKKKADKKKADEKQA